MNKNKLTILIEILITFVVAFVPIITSKIICVLNNQTTLISYALSTYIGELLMITVIILYPKRQNSSTQKVSEEATQHTQEDQQK